MSSLEALAQLLAFTAGQPAWQAQAQFAGNGNLDRGGVSAPPTSDERAGAGRTNYAARHQVRGATYIHDDSTAVVPPDLPRHMLLHRDADFDVIAALRGLQIAPH